MLRIIRSMDPLTEFTPTWNIPIWTTQYDNAAHIDSMRDWIIDNEQSIIDKYSGLESKYVSDGGTGLGSDSLTAQYNKFNLFKDAANVPEFHDLLKFIRAEYGKFMVELNAPVRACSMYAWANVMRTGQKIKRHNHGGYHYSYISGNMHFDNYDTTTRYYNPFDSLYYDFDNVKGGLTFFPSYVYHSTGEFAADGKRVSMAFDLFDQTHLRSHDSNYIAFDDGLQ